MFKVKEFYSYCGGLAARECQSFSQSNIKANWILRTIAEHANNPLRFRFSWSPRGALLSQCNSASFVSGGKQVDISSKDLMGVAKPYFVLDGYYFVAYPNRNSVPFKEFYNIPEAETLVRGTLRYEGNPAFVKTLKDLGWLEAEPKDWLKPGLTWAEVTHKAIESGEPNERYLPLFRWIHFRHSADGLLAH